MFVIQFNKVRSCTAGQHMIEKQDQQFTTLKLPKRYEALEREATQSDADLARIVQRVDTAASRVEGVVVN
jgi:hypothetical protein